MFWAVASCRSAGEHPWRYTAGSNNDGIVLEVNGRISNEDRWSTPASMRNPETKVCGEAPTI